MLTIVLQAGGASRRMGQDKARMPFLGQPLIQRVYQRVAPLAGEVLVTTNDPPDYAFLGIPAIPDRLPGRGALGGLFTALSAARYPLVAVVACDMPFVNPGLLQLELALLDDQQLDAAIPMTAEGAEPFHAIYRRQACLPLVQAALRDGRMRVNSWFEQANIRFISADEVAVHDPQGLAFWNVNTPEEFRQAEAIARQQV